MCQFDLCRTRRWIKREVPCSMMFHGCGYTDTHDEWDHLIAYDSRKYMHIYICHICPNDSPLLTSWNVTESTTLVGWELVASLIGPDFSHCSRDQESEKPSFFATLWGTSHGDYMLFYMLKILKHDLEGRWPNRAECGWAMLELLWQSTNSPFRTDWSCLIHVHPVWYSEKLVSQLWFSSHCAYLQI